MGAEVHTSHITPADAEAQQHGKLRRVPGPISWILILICVMEFGERFVYHGISGPFQNYIQHPYQPGSRIPGALGKGQAVGVSLGDFFKFWSYLCVAFGGITADQYLGKYKTILASSPIYIAGLALLVATATPVAIKAGAGTGGLKACIAPMAGEQNTGQGQHVETLNTGETVLVDHDLTTARIMMWYYWAANIGALSSLLTVELEKNYSFWLAYLVPLLLLLVVLAVFVAFSHKINKIRPQGSPILDASRTLAIGLKEGSLEKAKPSLRTRHNTLTDTYVEQVKDGLLACKYFLLFPFYFICWTQIFNNLISQAGDMKMGDTPNDLMQSLENLFQLCFIPILDLLVYPAFRKAGITFNPILRIFVGFMCAALGMTYACVLQYFIYHRPANSIPVWIQAPAYVFGALSEIFVIVTGLEVAFLKAPENLRAFVSSIFWITLAVGAAIGIALAPVSQDPYMVWTYAGLAIGVFLAGCVFFVCFRHSIAGEVPLTVGFEVAEQPVFDGPGPAGSDPLNGKLA
ncbi:POT family protein [Exophiala viscosa]|uniref:POT family protein n=1 Tax=Exophiala viscosa TaxID=2486360 RepID=A0AAN6IDY1_9EURO|nr:POT family protein [Exophiala viscosa]